MNAVESSKKTVEAQRTRKRAGHTQMQWEAKFFRCGCCCVYCGEPLTLRGATKDHLTPQSRGGSDDITNIAPACYRCNIQKSDRTYDEFLRAKPVFVTTASKFTALLFPLQQASALAQPSCPVKKESKPAPRRVQPMPTHLDFWNDPMLREDLKREVNQTSWAWRNPA